MWKIRKNHQKIIQNETLLFDRFIDYSNNYGLVYPNNYKIGMSNLGLHFIYKLINSRGDANCERFFYEDSSTEVLSLESNRYLNEFEVILFSLTYELDYLNVIKLLKNANIEIFGNKRTQLFPILIGGGAALTINPSPLLKLFDFIFLGNADKKLNKIIDIINKKDYETKIELWNNLKGIPGLIPGEFISKTNYYKICNEKPEDPIYNSILTPNTELKNMFLIEIGRSCPHNCKFCSVSNIYGKYKIFDSEKIIAILNQYKNKIKKVGLLSSAVLEHKNIKDVLEFCIENNLTVNTSSLRLDLLNSEILNLLKEAGNKTLTIALESGDEKLRLKCGKSFSNDEIINKIQLAVNSGFHIFKFYIIIGLPGEGEEEIFNSIKFFKRLRSELGRVSLKLKLSINPFIPKPHTKWENKMFSDRKIIKKRFRMLYKELKKVGYSLKLGKLEESELQYLIANGNSEIIYPIINSINKPYSDIIQEVKSI
ncbi:B12-binding domain-containing radical SAM protein [Candidatus Dependentiae bacterium]|nr:B12-binding domain-containing radical SAM protein [Candidatus Dependentiae bacterium]